MKIRTIVFLTIMLISLSACNKTTPKADYGVVPLPKEIKNNDGQFILNEKTIISYQSSKPELVNEANHLKNYVEDITGFELNIIDNEDIVSNAINLSLREGFTDNEAYRITVTPQAVAIEASDAEAAFHAIQTIRKSLPVGYEKQDIALPCGEIYDYPRFGYRGLHVDVSRHFFPIDSIKEIIDIMALHNLNKFHFHLTDDQGWRIEIDKYPKLTEIGSMRSGTKIGKTDKFDTIPHGGFYTKEELKDLVKYAESRHIDIIPEIDLPGHTLSALAAYPEFGCTGGPYEVWKDWGITEEVICPGNENAMVFLEDVLEEVMEIFPSEFIHIGGDECPRTRWEECPKCQNKIKELGLKDDENHSAEDYLQSYVTRRMESFIENHGRRIIGWDEILEGEIAPNATVMSWRGSIGGMEAAKMHHDVIMTPNDRLYFDYYQTLMPEVEPLSIGGYNPIRKVYDYEPIPEELTSEEAIHILGAQANVWTEYTNNYSLLLYRILPRLSALSDVQWCLPEQKDYYDFVSRLYRLSKLFDLYGWNYSTFVFDIDAQIVPQFENKRIAIILTKYGDGDIYYTVDGKTPTVNSTKYTDTVYIDKNCDFKAILIRENSNGNLFHTNFDFSLSSMKPITLKTMPHKSYTFDGPNVLIDGLRGSMNYKSGRWLGFFGETIDATIDLESKMTISKLKFNCNINVGDWIYNAKNVMIRVSDDGINFKEIVNKDFDILPLSYQPGILPIEIDFDAVNTRYVNIIIEPFQLPEEHSGFGYPAWIFTDELAIY